jgi:hypothetical protein
MIYDVEITDTFGGEANYSWVHRHTLNLPDGASDRAIVKAVAKPLGDNLDGWRTKREALEALAKLQAAGILQNSITP